MNEVEVLPLKKKAKKRKKRDPSTYVVRGFTKPIKPKASFPRNVFGRFITQRRRELNISNWAFAKRAKVYAFDTFKWEAGTELPSLTLVRRIAKALEVGPTEIRKQLALGKMYRVMHDMGFITDENPNAFVIKIVKQRNNVPKD